MNGQEERWFVKFRGHTLGPLNSQQVKISIQKRELGATDKIASASHPVWKEIREENAFQNFFSTPTQTLPAPSTLLLKRKKVEIPKVQKLEEANVSTSAVSVETKEKVPASPPITGTHEIGKKSFADKKRKTSLGKNQKSSLEKSAKQKKTSKTSLNPQKTKPILKPEVEPRIQAQTKSVDLETKASALTTSPASAPATARASTLTTSPPEEPKKLRGSILETFPPKPILPPVGASLEDTGSDTRSLIGLWQEWKDFDPPLDRPQKSLAKRATLAKSAASPSTHLSLDSPVAPVSQSARIFLGNNSQLLTRTEENFSPPSQLHTELKNSQIIQIQLRLSKAWIAVFILFGISLFAAGLFFFETKKTRDLKDFHLSDPSSPTIQPSTPDDPIPSLKAPTRPKRE